MSNTFTDQRLLSAQELSRLAAAIDGTYVFPSTAGGAVTANSGLTLNVAAIVGGTVTINGSTVSTAYAGGTVTHAAADTTNPRRDYIYYNTSGAVGIKQGTPAAKPVLPDLASTEIAIAEIYIAANDTTISGASEIIDKRQAAPESVFNSIRTQFRAARKLIGLFSALHYTSVDGAGSYASQPVGVGFTHGNSASSASSIGTLTNALLEGYVAGVTGATSTDAIGAVTGAASLVATTAPNKNPRMLIRWFPGSSNANLTSTFAGFMAGGSAPTATTAGAYLRANTTGNLFFVTRQGGSETTTDLGARPTTPTSYEIWTEDAGVTWYCRNDTTATVVATHTTNVPTATVALGHVIGGISASGNLNAHNTVFCEIESSTVA